ncbi:MAG: hypothetical protein IJB10_02425 [Clostridia bacterium]|nr:hypothetical protein [Clostridia bacterium]
MKPKQKNIVVQTKEDLVEEVKKDFYDRQQQRKNFEAIWKLNNNFLIGNQYSCINTLSDIEEYDKQYFWQQREVFNHIAPIVEARISKLATVRPQMSVVPSSGQEEDLKVAKLSRDIIKSVYEKLSLKEKIAKATQWSEITGTCFYKIVWNSKAGKAVYVDQNKNKVYEGEVEVSVVPPYEIFPESSGCEDIDSCFSIIHAKAYNTRDIKTIWGVDVIGEDIDTMSLSSVNNLGGLGYRAGINKIENQIKKNHAIVIERYEAVSQEHPNGRLTIVCQDKLLFDGDLPYLNAFNGSRGFPFVKQVSLENPGCFWGSSIIERIIPVQRAYNAVKNRKHEYLNRLSMGVLTVEDGSVDTESLQEEGLSPGKVLVYRQGSNAPKMMQNESLPLDYEKEEEKLLKEFSEISGVSNIMLTSSWSNSLSGTALELMVEQDSARLSNTVEKIKTATNALAKQILKLYKQFAITPRLLKLSSNNGQSEVIYWKNSDLGCEELVFTSETENGESVFAKREQILKLLQAGLLCDQNGKFSNSLRVKILELFGLGVWEGNTDEDVLQKNYADTENFNLINNIPVEVLEIDNNDIHISRHISFMLDKEYQSAKKQNPNLQEKFLKHIREHKKLLNNN